MTIKSLITFTAIITSIAYTSFASASPQYSFSYQFDNNDIISGTFDGTASGNLITNLQNITLTLSFNTITFDNIDTLFGYDLNNNPNSNAAALSFDGTQNNINLTAYSSLSLFLPPIQFISLFNTNYYDQNQLKFATYYTVDQPPTLSKWSLTDNNISSVPEPTSISLLAFGYLGYRLSLKNKAKQSLKQARMK